MHVLSCMAKVLRKHHASVCIRISKMQDDSSLLDILKHFSLVHLPPLNPKLFPFVSTIQFSSSWCIMSNFISVLVNSSTKISGAYAKIFYIPISIIFWCLHQPLTVSTTFYIIIHCRMQGSFFSSSALIINF